MEECYRLLTDQFNFINPKGHRVVPDVSKPLPLRGPPSQVTIQTKYIFNKDLEYLLSGEKGRRTALSISKLKATHYLDFGHEELVPLLWIKSEREYDISKAYRITHCPRLADYGVIFFKQTVRCILIRLSKIEFCLITFNLELQIFYTFSDDDVLYPKVDCVEEMNFLALRRTIFFKYVLPYLSYVLRLIALRICIWDLTAQRSEEALCTGFNHSALGLTLGRWAVPVSFKSEKCTSSVPPLSIPVIDPTPPKPVPSTTQAPIFTATTTTKTTTTTTLPPPLQQQISLVPDLASRVLALEQVYVPHMINQTINEVVKEAIYVALQAPLRDRFRELPEEDMKEILHQRMFKSGFYKLLPEHVALYEALEASMEHANRDEFLAEKEKSCHRVVPDVSKPLPLRGPLEYYTIVSKPRAVMYKDKNDQKKMMRETQVHKFSDGTVNRILDKLDHMVKDFKLFKYNPSMEIRIWSEDDRRRSKEFIEVIEGRLKIRRIIRSLESFFGLGVFGLSSSGTDFNHSALGLTLGRWEVPASFEYEKCTSSGVGTLLIGRGHYFA
nr:hypothetical protein [Tanacetum cinerariifolium]